MSDEKNVAYDHSQTQKPAKPFVVPAVAEDKPNYQ
jgi:hypothetical protein